ncbi:hypothetical protein GW17_00026928 [Ensete ventricosum]|nr:hypothetical protein GW17_00026928 [Ensete ventricosum]
MVQVPGGMHSASGRFAYRSAVGPVPRTGKWSPVEKEAAKREARRGGGEDEYRWAVAGRLPGATENRARSRQPAAPFPAEDRRGRAWKGEGGKGRRGVFRD